MTKEKRLKKRHNAEKRFRFYGLASIFLALLFVLILVEAYSAIYIPENNPIGTATNIAINAINEVPAIKGCLLYTSDAADE